MPLVGESYHKINSSSSLRDKLLWWIWWRFYVRNLVNKLLVVSYTYHWQNVFFLIMQSFARKLAVVLQTLKIFVQEVKDVYTPPFPHLRTKGMGKCETEPLIIRRIIKIVWECSSWEYTGWEFLRRIYRRRVWWVGIFRVADSLKPLQAFLNIC